MSARRVEVLGWLPHVGSTEFAVYPLGHAQEQHALRNRLTVAINSGCAALHVRMTADEAKNLIEALQWAIDSADAPADANGRNWAFEPECAA